MEIITGGLYFVSDEFFTKIQDPYLKINYKDTKRPHYFAFKFLKPMLQSGRIIMTIPDKPSSKNQKYIRVEEI